MHILVDSIHGVINIDDELHREIQWIAKTPYFQRLRYIKQLGLVDIVYPGATHNRFSHSIGVAYLANKAISAIINNLDTAEDNMEKKLNDFRIPLIIAGLLHDIGHGPFSHLFESVFSNQEINKCIPTHEDWGEKFYDTLVEDATKEEAKKEPKTDIIKHLEQAKTIYYAGNFNKYAKDYDSVDPNDEKIYKFLHHIVDSQLDVDRFDYLLRDSHYCGASYGKFDVQWIISNLRKIDTKLGINEKAIVAVEDYLFSRKTMYERVTFHPKIRAYEHLVSAFLERVYETASQSKLAGNNNSIIRYFGKLKGNLDNNNMNNESNKNISDEQAKGCKNKILKECFDEYQGLTDCDVLTLIKKSQKHDDEDDILKKIGLCLLGRKMPAVYVIDKSQHCYVKSKIKALQDKHPRFKEWKFVFHYDDKKIKMYNQYEEYKIYSVSPKKNKGEGNEIYENIAEKSDVIKMLSEKKFGAHHLYFYKFSDIDESLNQSIEDCITDLLSEGSISGSDPDKIEPLDE